MGKQSCRQTCSRLVDEVQQTYVVGLGRTTLLTQGRHHSMLRCILVVLFLLGLMIAPNLIWLGTSTIRIVNKSDSAISNLSYSACEQSHEVGTLQSNRLTFNFLPPCGDDTLSLHLGKSKFCQMYVEGDLYHVEATIESKDKVRCEYAVLLSTLFITKLLP